MRVAGVTRQGTPLRIDVNGRQIEFRWRPDHDGVLSLVRAHVLSSASLTEFSFEAHAQEGDDRQLMQFAVDVAAICTFARGASVTVAMLEMRDVEDVLVRRVLTQPVESKYRDHETVADEHLQRLFRETFSTYVAMRQSHRPWSKLPSYFGSIEDCPYLEQKFASLMMTLEFFMRNCLIEAGQSEDEVSSLTFHELIGATKHRLSWNVPKHYSVGQATRLLRNAVMHGGELPTKDNAEFRRQFDKWRLFLIRRVLVRLGYTGEVVSPFQGIESSSPVDDFSPDHNSFEPNGAAADSWIRFYKELGSCGPKQQSSTWCTTRGKVYGRQTGNERRKGCCLHCRSSDKVRQWANESLAARRVSGRPRKSGQLHHNQPAMTPRAAETFEHRIHQIHELVETFDAEVTWNERIPDPDNPNRKRQIDIAVRRGQHLTLIECRLHRGRQDVKWIEELIGRRQSLGADAVIAVSSSGFTNGALAKAKRYEVITRELRELTDEEVRSWGRWWR